MKIRFSVRSLLVFTAIIAVSVFLSAQIYRQYIIPRTPLAWNPCTSERLKTIFEGKHPVLICVLGDVNSLEYVSTFDTPRPDFRRFIFEHRVELLIDPSSGWSYPPSSELFDLLQTQQPVNLPLVPHYVLVLPEEEKLIKIPCHAALYIDGKPDNGKNAADSITKAIQSQTQ